MKQSFRILAPSGGVPIHLVPPCFKGSVSQIRIYSNPGVIGYCSVMTGVPGTYAQLVAECKGETGIESEALSSEVYGQYGIHLLPDSHCLSIYVEFEAELPEKE